MQEQVKVWDLPLRLFHWLLVLTFFTAYFTEDDLLSTHAWAGYGVLGLLLFRLIWGFTGNVYARFSNFVCTPVQSFNYLKSVLFGQPKRYLGHNPAGAAMIVLLLSALLLTAVSGLILYAADQGLGPLAGLIAQGNAATEELWEELHEFCANFTLFLVVLHVLGVIVESVLHKENLARAMLHGNKRAGD